MDYNKEWASVESMMSGQFTKDAEWGVYAPGELAKIEKRRDALWHKEDSGSLNAAEKSELADLQKKLEKHYAKLKADRKRAGFKDAKDADFHTEVGKGASARREAFKLAEQKTIESYNKTRPGKQFSIWAVYQSGTGVYSIGPGKSGYKGEKEDKTYQEWKSRPLFLTGKERKEFQAGKYPASAKEQLKKERAQGISDTKDEMSVVADMLNGKFSKDAIPMSAVSVRGEDRYAFSIGHKPSGNGHWCFKIGDKEFWVTGYYTDAKKAAIREAARLGEYSVTVLP